MEDNDTSLRASGQEKQPEAKTLIDASDNLHNTAADAGILTQSEHSDPAVISAITEANKASTETQSMPSSQFTTAATEDARPRSPTSDDHVTAQRSSSPRIASLAEPETHESTTNQSGSEEVNIEPTTIVTQVAPMIQPDVDVDDETYAESTSSTYFSSIASEIQRGIIENERVYPQYGKHSYGMPIDEDEMDRMDLQHRKYEMVIGDKHFLAPIGTHPQRVLDLATGTGIWALDVADMFPSAQVIGVDIAPIQPRWVAPNCQFEIDDIEEPWTWKPNSFDFIHLRDPLYMVRDWPKLMGQIFHHLKPGGWCELAAIYPLPMCDDGSMPDDSAFLQICKKFLEASELFGTPADVPPRFKDFLHDGGFVDVREHIFKIPSSPWPKDKRLKKIGALELTNVVHGATAFGLRAFTQVFGWTKEQVEVAMVDFRRDVKNRNYHHYCQYIVTYGQKPLDTPMQYE